ncbi:quinone oxidoreductase family protein [Amycolatopsis albispora]|uniref:Enoyl reductase (ER) domain-containing protein n=1 Tax=Amycolatopsis albispora TaxID=1804986 RepID=A0A344L346_9PSEU|nr:zinc-binding alcohol dehydrogenase family protein [Amycolatopsis albispora]AXB42470.1 hypothetical protein A4R43_07955 [Amycolatopsis albispora]
MDAAVLRNFGEAPRFEQFPEPTPGEGEVLVEVAAAALPPVARLAASNPDYGRGMTLPSVCGMEGVGRLEDGTRVAFFARSPNGSMAQYTVSRSAMCVPLPDGVDDVTAAALYNPGLTSWAAYNWTAKFSAGETALVLGATGFAGKLAVQIAKILGAKRVIGAGRNPEVLESLHDLGVDATIQIDQPDEDLAAAFAKEAGEEGFDVIMDYLWGHPAEVLLSSLPRHLFPTVETRYIQLGNSAGSKVNLHADWLRRTGVTLRPNIPAPLEPMADLGASFHRELTTRAASGELRMDIETVPLAEIEKAWERTDMGGRRLVLIP